MWVLWWEVRIHSLLLVKKKTISETVSPTESEDSIPKFLSVLPHVATQVMGHILFNWWHSWRLQRISVSPRPAWSTGQVPEQPLLQREIVFWNATTKINKKRRQGIDGAARIWAMSNRHHSLWCMGPDSKTWFIFISPSDWTSFHNKDTKVNALRSYDSNGWASKSKLGPL